MNKIEQKKKINKIKKKEKKTEERHFLIIELCFFKYFLALSLIIVLSYITFYHFNDLYVYYIFVNSNKCSFFILLNFYIIPKYFFFYYYYFYFIFYI